ncbi:AAA family ATPase [Burkholderia stabilis]|nr:AAA family ATPase [Burkholderia stabilis]AOR73126.1 AAA family ATPase [Burkholderia stabilis]HDR9496248.1 AAA family ATPase [Burkholderia stabilis]HDR9527808.1 AAA family ATPase [Burkholderia stabilis]HDR9542819.1 AAA family ATPase [Burkholderia stabilis]HDR9573054.1 AAA family ATPase [Burkholderia stabilis]
MLGGKTGAASAFWFVGASFGASKDQTARFLEEGIWEVHTPTSRESADVNAMRVGDRIAIKAAYVRKRNLPFDIRDQSVSVMGIKAIGTVISNEGNGYQVGVQWTAVEPVREWFFYTYRPTIWRVLPDTWKAEALIRFTFDNEPQDFERFLQSPYWRDRYGVGDEAHQPFRWTGFFQAIADALRAYRSNRSVLVAGLQDIASRVDVLDYLNKDRLPDSQRGFVRDICPFTVMGSFNRGITDINRKQLADELARFLGVSEPVPASFEGVPLLNNLKSWYFPFEDERPVEQIDQLWDVFAAAIDYAESDDDTGRERFAKAFDQVNGKPGVGWNLTMGLFWIRPWSFPTLDGNSRRLIREKLLAEISTSGPNHRCSATDYLALIDTLERRFQEPDYAVHSFPDLSQQAWVYQPAGGGPRGIREDADGEGNEGADVISESLVPDRPIVPYAVDDIFREGCFVERATVERLLQRLEQKKNLVLQGPPGTGKTWLARRLAFALIGEKNDSRVRRVQFHPNLSYEDFVRGWRPTGDGKLALVEGVFMEAAHAALRAPDQKFVVVIEEINRGNPAQIFGELLTLLEAGKRTPNEAIELCYPDADGKRRPVHIPDNLYVIGTMNLADRSLALVDMALRRRFAFAELEPQLGPVWRQWVTRQVKMDVSLAGAIELRFEALNRTIANDPRLGEHFRLGHSYVTPTEVLEAGSTRQWFIDVVDTEIRPLLDEYWFDTPDEARKAVEQLLHDW